MQSFIDDAKKAAASGAGAGAPAAVWMPPMHAEERAAPRCQCQCQCGKGHAGSVHQQLQHHHHHHDLPEQRHGHHQQQNQNQHLGMHAPGVPLPPAATSGGEWSWIPTQKHGGNLIQNAALSSSFSGNRGAPAHGHHAKASPEISAWRAEIGEPSSCGGQEDFKRSASSGDETSWNLNFMDSGSWRACASPPFL